MIRAVPFLLFAMPAFAEGNLSALLEGRYGAVDDPAFSCAENPVELRFMDQPAHAIFSWAFPRKNFNDQMATEAVYDMRGEVALGLVMRLEGETRQTAGGETVLWILRPDADLMGFCWGRTDWSLVKCVDPFRRCDAAPVS